MPIFSLFLATTGFHSAFGIFLVVVPNVHIHTMHLTVYALRATNTIRFPKRAHALATVCTENTPSNEWSWNWRAWTPSVRFPSHAPLFLPLSGQQTFFSPIQCSCLPHLYHPPSILGDVVCTCSIFRTHLLLSLPLSTLLNPMTPERVSLNLSPSGCSTRCLFFQTSIHL